MKITKADVLKAISQLHDAQTALGFVRATLREDVTSGARDALLGLVLAIAEAQHGIMKQNHLTL